MELKGKRITIRPIEIDHINQIKNWGSHENPLLADYNINDFSENELLGWYCHKIGKKNQKYFSVFNEDSKLIGYFGLRKIRKRLFRDSELGIVFDPNYVNNGYGTETITSLLDYYFNHMNMKTLYLDVAKFNKRALQCYKKAGFTIIESYLDKFFDQGIDRANLYFKKEESSFVIRRGKIYNYIYRMKIDRKTYLKEKDQVHKGNIENRIKPIIK